MEDSSSLNIFKNKKKMAIRNPPTDEDPFGDAEILLSEIFSEKESNSDIKEMKQYIMEHPEYLIHVLLFWIHLQYPHGTKNHNEFILKVGEALKNKFLHLVYKKCILYQSEQELASKVTNIDIFINELRENVEKENRKFDTTFFIFHIVKQLGNDVLKLFLLEHGIISEDMSKNDMISAWMSVEIASQQCKKKIKIDLLSTV